jgi:predicted transcriptional regulator
MNQNTPISEVMTPHVIVGHPSSTLHQLKDLFMNYSLHHLVITDEQSGNVVGIVTASDLLKFALNNPNPDLDHTPVNDIMTKDVVFVTPSTSLGESVARLNKANFSALVVEEDGKPVGFMSVRDLPRIMSFMFTENYNYD